MRISIVGGRLIDPANRQDGITALHILDEEILGAGRAPAGFTADRVIDASGLVVCPGLIDLCARFREPGHEHKATIASESEAAARGGITTVCIPPDTDPIIDTPAVVELIHQRSTHVGKVRVEIIGALTNGLRGEQLAELGALGDAGCLGVSNALAPIRDTEIMRRAMEYAATFGLPVLLHAEDAWLAEERFVHDGVVSTRLGIAGIPETAETIAVARELLLIEQTGVTAHFYHLSSARAVSMLREARGRGLPVSADVTAHHLHLTEDQTIGFNNECHVRPPLRTERDRAGLRAGLREGVISAICSDHQPHERDARLNPFCATEPGIAGLETLLPLALQMADEEQMTLSQCVSTLTHQPAKVLGIGRGHLSSGAPADVCLFDPRREWTLDEHTVGSRGHNTPFWGQPLRGRVIYTLRGGQVVHGLDARPG